jgi:hypothetical protein
MYLFTHGYVTTDTYMLCIDRNILLYMLCIGIFMYVYLPIYRYEYIHIYIDMFYMYMHHMNI